jgi:uncharacterized protein (DUF1810 family)
MQQKSDPYNLQRFVEAQNAVSEGGCSFFDQARSELRAGKKLSHWMWFIFPQIKGLGTRPRRHQNITQFLPNRNLRLT